MNFLTETQTFLRNNKGILFFFAIWLIRIYFLQQRNDSGFAINKFIIVQLFAEMGIFFLLLSKGFNFFQLFAIQPMMWFGILYFYGMFTLFYGAIPLMGSYFAFQNIIMLGMLYYLALQIKDTLQLERIFVSFLCILLILFLFRTLIRGEGFHSVTYSTIAAILFTYCLAENGEKKRPVENQKVIKKGLYLGGIFLLLTSSSGAMVSTAVAMCIIAFRGKSGVLKAGALLFLVAMLVAYFTGTIDWVISFLFPNKSMAVIKSGNGRETIWRLILEKAEMRPWFGWGYATVERLLSWYCTDAHNAVVGTLGSQGYVGCFFLIMGMLSLLSFVLRKHSIGFSGLSAASVCALVNSNTSNFITSKTGVAILTFQMLLVLAVLYNKKESNNIQKLG